MKHNQLIPTNHPLSDSRSKQERRFSKEESTGRLRADGTPFRASFRCDGDGNIVRSLDICAQKEYNYVYDKGALQLATASDVMLSGEAVTGRTALYTVIQIILERHTQRIEALEKELLQLKAIQQEIRDMNEVLITITNELKHTNERSRKNEQRISLMERRPHIYLQQIITATVSALAASIISFLIGISM